MESRTVSLGSPAAEMQVRSPLAANMIAFDWIGGEAAEIEFRVKTGAGWGDWLHADGNPDEGPDPGSPETDPRTATMPIWLGEPVRDVQVRNEDGVSGLRMHAINSEAAPRGGWGVPPATASPAQPGIISRAGWGADETLRSCDPRYADRVRYAVVHHTATGNGYSQEEAPAIIRAIYHYHTQTRGFCDIGYNFLVDRFGRIYEGRFGGIAEAVIGAHASGFNSESTGVATLGNFETDPVPNEVLSALRKLLAWKLDHHGVHANSQILVVSGGSNKYPAGTPVTLWTISSHRDVTATACPGQYLYPKVEELRPQVQAEIELSRLHSAPSVSSWAPGRLDIFGRAANGVLSHKWWDGRRWSAWESLGGVLTAAPSAVSWGRDRIDVFVRGSDNALWHAWWDGHRWQGWESLGGVLSAAPAAASRGPGRLDVVVRGTDNGLWQIFYDGASWSGWHALGGAATSDPAAVSWGEGRLDVFVRGTDSALWHKWWDGSSWSGWNSLGGVLDSGPDVSSWGLGRLDVFVRGTNKALWHAWFTGGAWYGWESLGGHLDTDPTAVSWSNNRIDVFARAGDGRLWQKFWAGSGWYESHP